MAGPPEILVQDSKALADLVGELRRAGRFALDTEFVSEDTFEPVLGLIQVATPELVAAVDPFGAGDLTEFWEVVTDPGSEVVMHAAGEDLRICRIASGKLPAGLIDVQVAAGLVGLSYPLSLGNLLQQVLGVRVPGGESRTDWRRRPLSEAQIDYALDDVRYLLAAANELESRLESLGRLDWARGEYLARLQESEARDDPERWRRLSGLGGMSRRSLEAARLLWRWRQSAARRGDRPVRQVMRDDLLTAIAKRMPANRKQLEALRDFNRPHLMSRGEELTRIVAEAREVPDDQLPEPSDRPDDGPGMSMVVSLLSATLNQCCAGAKVAAPIVGSNGDLKSLVRWNLAGRPPESTPELVQGWRGTVCGEVLLDVLNGRRALRIVDPESEIPVRLDPIDGDRP